VYSQIVACGIVLVSISLGRLVPLVVGLLLICASASIVDPLITRCSKCSSGARYGFS